MDDEAPSLNKSDTNEQQLKGARWAQDQNKKNLSFEKSGAWRNSKCVGGKQEYSIRVRRAVATSVASTEAWIRLAHGGTSVIRQSGTAQEAWWVHH
ncbi:unnamed protein product [Caenorhabditis bovis]|uniref:Uncharacterized protein n=1 Tax=Caenorhabditis bovis TaxID=2654633 RepID=A0A8S1ET87_9PELO|nr:unnamed protein product [Caenorhabditis bovis]